MNKGKVITLLFFSIFLVFVLMGCEGGYNDEGEDPEDAVVAPENGEDPEEEEEEEELPIITMEELAENDGRDGARAYVLVEGIVYDVTDSPRWRDGNHNGNQAGQDLTDEILDDSPHGRRVLERFEAVGRIEE